MLEIIKPDLIFDESLDQKMRKEIQSYDTTNECDVTVNCDCGKSFRMYLSSTYYQCECKRIYHVRQIVEVLDA